MADPAINSCLLRLQQEVQKCIFQGKVNDLMDENYIYNLLTKKFRTPLEVVASHYYNNREEEKIGLQLLDDLLAAKAIVSLRDEFSDPPPILFWYQSFGFMERLFLQGFLKNYSLTILTKILNSVLLHWSRNMATHSSPEFTELTIDVKNKIDLFYKNSITFNANDIFQYFIDKTDNVFETSQKLILFEFILKKGVNNTSAGRKYMIYSWNPPGAYMDKVQSWFQLVLERELYSIANLLVEYNVEEPDFHVWSNMRGNSLFQIGFYKRRQHYFDKFQEQKSIHLNNRNSIFGMTPLLEIIISFV